MNAPTAQDTLKATLAKLDIPSRSIEVYESQIIITCLCVESASTWAPVLNKFATVKKVALKSLDKTKQSTVFNRAYVTVDRTFATI